jgi:Na+/phosphate symporter
MPLVRVRRILSRARPQPRGSFEAGPVTDENVLALGIGSESGTIISAIPGGLSPPPEGKRLAGAHLIFNVGTGLVALQFINIFIDVALSGPAAVSYL